MICINWLFVWTVVLILCIRIFIHKNMLGIIFHLNYKITECLCEYFSIFKISFCFSYFGRHWLWWPIKCYNYKIVLILIYITLFIYLSYLNAFFKIINKRYNYSLIFNKCFVHFSNDIIIIIIILEVNHLLAGHLIEVSFSVVFIMVNDNELSI